MKPWHARVIRQAITDARNGVKVNVDTLYRNQTAIAIYVRTYARTLNGKRS